jgi:hypothetical protein
MGVGRDFRSAESKALRIPEVMKNLGSIVGAHIELRGICSRCAKGQTENRRTRTRRSREARKGAHHE